MKRPTPIIYKMSFFRESGFMLPIHSMHNEKLEYFSRNCSVSLSSFVKKVFHVLLRKHLLISGMSFTFSVLSVNTWMQIRKCLFCSQNLVIEYCILTAFVPGHLRSKLFLLLWCKNHCLIFISVIVWLHVNLSI